MIKQIAIRPWYYSFDFSAELKTTNGNLSYVVKWCTYSMLPITSLFHLTTPEPPPPPPCLPLSAVVWRGGCSSKSFLPLWAPSLRVSFSSLCTPRHIINHSYPLQKPPTLVPVDHLIPRQSSVTTSLLILHLYSITHPPSLIPLSLTVPFPLTLLPTFDLAVTPTPLTAYHLDCFPHTPPCHFSTSPLWTPLPFHEPCASTSSPKTMSPPVSTSYVCFMVS